MTSCDATSAIFCPKSTPQGSVMSPLLFSVAPPKLHRCSNTPPDFTISPSRCRPYPVELRGIRWPRARHISISYECDIISFLEVLHALLKKHRSSSSVLALEATHRHPLSPVRSLRLFIQQNGAELANMNSITRHMVWECQPTVLLPRHFY